MNCRLVQIEKTIKNFGDKNIRVRGKTYNIKVSDFLVSRDILVKLPRSWAGSIRRLLYFSLRVRFGTVHKFCRQGGMWPFAETDIGALCGDIAPFHMESKVAGLFEVARAAAFDDKKKNTPPSQDLMTVNGRRKRPRKRDPIKNFLKKQEKQIEQVSERKKDQEHDKICETCGSFLAKEVTKSMCTGCLSLVEQPVQDLGLTVGEPGMCPYSKENFMHRFEKDPKCKKRVRMVCKYCRQEPGYIHLRPPNTGYLSRKDLCLLPPTAWRTTVQTGNVELAQLNPTSIVPTYITAQYASVDLSFFGGISRGSIPSQSSCYD